MKPIREGSMSRKCERTQNAIKGWRFSLGLVFCLHYIFLGQINIFLCQIIIFFVKLLYSLHFFPRKWDFKMFRVWSGQLVLCREGSPTPQLQTIFNISNFSRRNFSNIFSLWYASVETVQFKVQTKTLSFYSTTSFESFIN